MESNNVSPTLRGQVTYTKLPDDSLLQIDFADLSMTAEHLQVCQAQRKSNIYFLIDHETKEHLNYVLMAIEKGINSLMKKAQSINMVRPY